MKKIEAYHMDDGAVIVGEATALRYKLSHMLAETPNSASISYATAAELVEALVNNDSAVVAALQRIRSLEPTKRAA